MTLFLNSCAQSDNKNFGEPKTVNILSCSAFATTAVLFDAMGIAKGYLEK
jgi:hypothetical protein